jgi:hypothetical protein
LSRIAGCRPTWAAPDAGPSACRPAPPNLLTHPHTPLPSSQIDEGLRSLDQALNLGFEDYGKCRSDKNLAKLRESPKFDEVLNKVRKGTGGF